MSIEAFREYCIISSGGIIYETFDYITEHQKDDCRLLKKDYVRKTTLKNHGQRNHTRLWNKQKNILSLGFILDYVEKNQHIINCAYDSIGREEMKRFFYADFIELVTNIVERAEQINHTVLKPDFKQFLCEFYTEALAGMLINWIKERDHYSHDKMTDYIFSILKSSITAILSETRETGAVTYE